MSETSNLFSNLSVVDAPLPARASSKISGPNPLTPALADSASARTMNKAGRWEGKGKVVAVPAASAAQVEGLIRDAATELGFGSTIRYTAANGGARLTLESVGGKEKMVNGKSRMTGGKPQIQKDGKPFSGEVKVHFSAIQPKETKTRRAAAPIAAPVAE